MEELLLEELLELLLEELLELLELLLEELPELLLELPLEPPVVAEVEAPLPVDAEVEGPSPVVTEVDIAPPCPTVAEPPLPPTVALPPLPPPPLPFESVVPEQAEASGIKSSKESVWIEFIAALQAIILAASRSIHWFVGIFQASAADHAVIGGMVRGWCEESARRSV